VLRRLSLRARLVLGVIVLAALGLAAADVATYTSLRSFLFDRTDSTLAQEHQSFENGPGPRGGPPGVYAEVRAEDGRTVLEPLTTTRFRNQSTASPPDLPETITVPATPNEGPDRAVYFTVRAEDGGGRYRVRAADEQALNAMLIVATPLRDVDATLHRLFLIELLVTVAVLGALVALALWVIRIGLRPLEAIAATAGAIAAGDLSRRVDVADERTEVGRLGVALNYMLGQIEASDRRLRRFVADASHELRTPLAAVRAYAELFTRGAERRPEDLARSMRGISRESERMSLLVEDLLLLARLDEKRPLEREPVELDHVVSEAVETAHAVDPQREIDVDFEPTVVLGDRDRLRQIVDNLLGNVRAHTPPASSVHVSVRSDNGTALIEVRDSGPSMPAEEVARVFERFYRSDESRSRASGGVGLGLSIVAAVAEAHGGRVTAESEPGKGSTFRIELPLADNHGN
jgi:two-component system OmpR family sensor kinase